MMLPPPMATPPRTAIERSCSYLESLAPFRIRSFKSILKSSHVDVRTVNDHPLYEDVADQLQLQREILNRMTFLVCAQRPSFPPGVLPHASSLIREAPRSGSRQVSTAGARKQTGDCFVRLQSIASESRQHYPQRALLAFR